MTDENKKLGFIKIHRSIWKNPICEKPNYLAVWVYLISHVNYTDKYTIINNEKVLVKRGTFIGSLKKISKQFNISIGTVSNILKYLEAETQIETKRTNKYTVFTVLNYDKYNNVETTVENKMKTKRKQIETTKKDKNVKKEENNILQTEVCEVLPDLLKDENKHIQIIGLFAKAKKVEFTNKEQQSSFIKRNLRSASLLKGYNIQRIVDTIKYLIDNADFKWTLESVAKYIDEDTNKLKTNQSEEQEIKSFFDGY